MIFTIFYSWQSDLPNQTNRGFIENAIELASKDIPKEHIANLEPRVDSATLGEPGSPSIDGTIFSKIDKCGIFIADVSIINKPINDDRCTPNPNVLLELGYAAARLGWNRVLMLNNEAFGAINELPFDIKQRRILKYFASSDETNRKEKRRQLANQIKSAVCVILQSGALVITHNPKDIRVAQQLNQMIDHYFWMSFFPFATHALSRSEAETERQVIVTANSQGYEDQSGTNYPDPKLLSSMMAAIRKTSILSDSSHMMTREGKPIRWTEVLLYGLKELVGALHDLLTKYSDRDDRLIGIADEVLNRSRTISSMISSLAGNPQFQEICETGLLDQHIEYIQYHVLSLFKALRIAREFLPREHP